MIIPLPHGIASIVVALIASAGALLSIISLSTCKFAFRSVLTSDESQYNGIYIGIWGWALDNDITIFSEGNCFEYSNSDVLDVFVSTTRGLGVLPVTFGVIATVICWSSLCIRLSKATVVITGLGFIIICICEVSKFLIFASSVCTDIDSGFPENNTQVSDCKMEGGSYICIAASVCWLLCAIILATIAMSYPKRF